MGLAQSFEEEGQTAGFGPCVHLPGFHGTVCFEPQPIWTEHQPQWGHYEVPLTGSEVGPIEKVLILTLHWAQDKGQRMADLINAAVASVLNRTPSIRSCSLFLLLFFFPPPPLKSVFVLSLLIFGSILILQQWVYCYYLGERFDKELRRPVCKQHAPPSRTTSLDGACWRMGVGKAVSSNRYAGQGGCLLG